MNTLARPVRVAIVGSGPSGMYAAGHLLRQHEVAVEVDVFDRQPTPWGLVRSGVAPDHPEKKNVSRVFELTACLGGFRFLGNVEVGRDVAVAELHAWYDAVIYAHGAAGSRPPRIAGSELPGCASASAFVGWYNGDPDCAHLDFDLSGERAVVVGNGNVALDLARILSLSGDALGATDIAPRALSRLRDSAIREVVVLGRRGPLQAAFNNPELAELGHLPDVDPVVRPEDLSVVDERSLAAAGWEARRKFDTLAGFSRRSPSGSGRRRVELRFLVSPTQILGQGTCSAVRLERNRLLPGGDVQESGVREDLSAGLVLFAIGFQGRALPGLPFDAASATVPNRNGRVLGVERPGAYVTGWIARGPSGIIGSNKLCAHRAVTALFEDLRAGLIGSATIPGAGWIAAELGARGVDPVGFAGWQNIDEAETMAGERLGRPRIKIVERSELLRAAAHSSE